MEPYIGQIQAFPYGFAPKGWMECSGQLLQIRMYTALYSILGAAYGGDGRNTFALPDLRGRAPMQQGGMLQLGGTTGSETHTLLTTEMPAHTHQAMADPNTSDQSTPVGNVWAATPGNTYGTSLSGALSQKALGSAGGSQPHSNMQPYTVLRFCIAVQGIFPPRD